MNTKKHRADGYRKLKEWLNPPKFIGVDFATGPDRCYEGRIVDSKWVWKEVMR